MSSLPDFEAWAVFASVAETRSFTRAASALGMTTATASRAVKRLEQRIGAALLSRTSRRFSLTPFGEEVAARAQTLVRDAERIEAAAVDRTLAIRGRVRLAAPMSFGQKRVAPLLPTLLRTYPDLEIDLHLSDALVDLVGEGFDFALRIARPDESSLKVRPIRDIRIKLVVSGALAGSPGLPIHPRMLRDYPCTTYAYQTNGDRWPFTHTSGEEVSVTTSGPLRVNNAEAALPVVLAGMCAAALPDFMAQDELRSGALIELLPDWRLPTASLGLVMPPSTLRPAAVTAAIDFFQQALSE